MSFVLAKPVDFSFFKDASNYVKGDQYFVRPTAERLEAIIDDLRETAAGSEDDVDDEGQEERPDYLVRADKMQLEGGWELVCRRDLDMRNSHYRNTIWLSEELELLDEEVRVSQLQYTIIAHHSNLGGYDSLGTIYPGLKVKGGGQWPIYLGEGKGITWALADFLSDAVADYQKPPLLLVKVSANLLRVDSPEAIVIHVLKKGNGYEVLDGQRAGSILRADQVTLCPASEEEKWQRFLITPRVLNVAPATLAILSSMQDVVARTIIPLTYELTVQMHNNNCFRYQPNGPDYVKADEKDTTKVSYLPTSKVERAVEKGEDPYLSTMRVTVSWAKFAQAMFIKDMFSASHYEVFHNNVSALCATEFGPEDTKPELLIVRGPEVATYYNLNSYAAPQQGELWSSCMRGVNSGYFGLYVENPNQVGLLISRDRKSGKIFGRGLVWTTEMGTFLDRVYSNTQIEQKRMQVWAEKNGYVDIWNGRRGSYPNEISVQLESPYHQYYPYMDSMAYLNPTSGVLANKSATGRHEMRSTGGDRGHASGEMACAATQRIAPKTKMRETVSKKYALEKYLKPLRTGGLEVEQNVVVDEVVGGFISSAQMAKVRIAGGTKVTLQSNPDYCYVASKVGTASAFYPKSDCAYSVLDKAFVLKKEAVEMPDGTFVSAGKAEKYRMLLLRRQPNKAHTTNITAPQPALAYAD